MEYKIVEKKNQKIQIELGHDRVWETDIEKSCGYGYFDVPNMYNTSNYSFLGRIKDAYQTILDGNGDTIETSLSSLHRTCNGVHRYLDREYGEMMRKDTIRKFKNIEFGYSIFLRQGSYQLESLIDKNGNLLSHTKNYNDYILFNTEEEAQKYIDDIILSKVEHLNSIDKRIKNGGCYIKEDFDYLHDVDKIWLNKFKYGDMCSIHVAQIIKGII